VSCASIKWIASKAIGQAHRLTSTAVEVVAVVPVATG
jgi:hypothetical protein